MFRLFYVLFRLFYAPSARVESDSKLRRCDLVGLRVHDVVQGSRGASRAIVMQEKPKRPVQFEITEQTQDTAVAWIKEGVIGDPVDS